MNLIRLSLTHDETIELRDRLISEAQHCRIEAQNPENDEITRLGYEAKGEVLRKRLVGIARALGAAPGDPA